MLVFQPGLHADLTVARDLLRGVVIVIANPAAGRSVLLAEATTLLEPPQRAELAARLPPEPEPWQPPG